jgi:hypothetical protein
MGWLLMAKEKLLTDAELAEAIKPIDPPSQATSQSTGSSKPTGTGRAKKGDSDLVAGLTSSVELLGVGVSFLDEFDGDLIHDKAQLIAESLVELSHHNPRARKMLEQLVMGSAWGGVALTLGKEIALPIALHHGVLPEPFNSAMADARDIPVKASKGDREKLISLVESPDGDSDTEQPR